MYIINLVNKSFWNLLHFTDAILRNDTTRIIQPEITYRPDNLGQPSGNTIGNGATNNAVDRKGSIAIGQSFFYTDYPPTDPNSGIYYYRSYSFFLLCMCVLVVAVCAHKTRQLCVGERIDMLYYDKRPCGKRQGAK